ncbi:MAG: hypothetical protein ACK4F8_13985 [Aquabacterium sp.]
MWKMLVGFVIFAGIAIFVMMKTGADVDMGGEKHGIDATHTEESHADTASAPAASAPAASAASAASAPASN